MKVFITGGSGFVGSHIVEAMLSAGHQVTLLTREPTALPAKSGLTIVDGGLENAQLHKVVSGHQALIHNALVWPEEPTETESEDLIATIRLGKAALAAGVEHLIYTSSTAVYRPFKPLMNEDIAVRPINAYAASKAACEAFLLALTYESAMRCNIVRLGPVVGGPAFRGAKVKPQPQVQRICELAARGEAIQVGAGEGRQLVGAKELAKVFLALLESERDRETYNAVSREPTLWKDVAQLAIDRAHTSSRLRLIETEELPFSFDTAKLERHFGLMLQSPMAVEAHVDYLLESTAFAQ